MEASGSRSLCFSAKAVARLMCQSQKWELGTRTFGKDLHHHLGSYLAYHLASERSNHVLRLEEVTLGVHLEYK